MHDKVNLLVLVSCSSSSYSTKEIKNGAWWMILDPNQLMGDKMEPPDKLPSGTPLKILTVFS